MARPLRLEFAGALYHVTSRGDGRDDIFLSDEDRIAKYEVRVKLNLPVYYVFLWWPSI